MLWLGLLLVVALSIFELGNLMSDRHSAQSCYCPREYALYAILDSKIHLFTHIKMTRKIQVIMLYEM